MLLMVTCHGCARKGTKGLRMASGWPQNGPTLILASDDPFWMHPLLTRGPQNRPHRGAQALGLHGFEGVILRITLRMTPFRPPETPK